uniref:Uncharacterized protein n=1 Tax=Mola mola TaxID=94237 RepID=A0A3Q3XLZ1_MOLML
PLHLYVWNILVTGTNRGIGLDLVRYLAEKTNEETRIYACCRDPEGDKAQALRDLAIQHPQKIQLIKLDQSNEDSISCAFQTVSAHIGAGGLNLLINNAAIAKPPIPGLLSDTNKQDMMEGYETNVVGPFLLTKVSLSPSSQWKFTQSAVINISTLGSSIEKLPENFHAAQLYSYRASKAALNMVTRCFSEEFKSQHILVAAVHPGWVRTDMGGEQATITTQESVLGMINLISSMSNKDRGMLLDWEGTIIPW